MFFEAFHNTALQTAAANGFLVLPGQQQAFLDMEASARQSFRPGPGIESYFFNDILMSMWNVRRCRMAEMQLCGASASGPAIDPLLDTTHEKIYRRIRQFEQTCRHALNRALRQLSAIQTEIRYRLQTFPPAEGTAPETQMPHTLSVLCDTATVLQGALKTGKTAIVRKVKLLPARIRDLARMLTPDCQQPASTPPTPPPATPPRAVPPDDPANR